MLVTDEVPDDTYMLLMKKKEKKNELKKPPSSIKIKLNKKSGFRTPYGARMSLPVTSVKRRGRSLGWKNGVFYSVYLHTWLNIGKVVSKRKPNNRL